MILLLEQRATHNVDKAQRWPNCKKSRGLLLESQPVYGGGRGRNSLVGDDNYIAGNGFSVPFLRRAPRGPAFSRGCKSGRENALSSAIFTCSNGLCQTTSVLHPRCARLTPAVRAGVGQVRPTPHPRQGCRNQRGTQWPRDAGSSTGVEGGGE